MHQPQTQHHFGGIPKSNICIGLPPCPVTVTTRIVIFLVGDPYKPSFATGILGGGTTDNPKYTTESCCDSELSLLVIRNSGVNWLNIHSLHLQHPYHHNKHSKPSYTL